MKNGKERGKRQYKIARSRSLNEWSIFRERGEESQWYGYNKIWVKDKRHAIKFISEQDAESVFISIKMGGELKTEEEYIEEAIRESEESRPKQYWGEYSS